MAASRSLILLTGATGFVGRQILRALQERGRKVRVVVRNTKKDQIGYGPDVEIAQVRIFLPKAQSGGPKSVAMSIP